MKVPLGITLKISILVQEKEELKLPNNHQALMIFDNFKAQCTEAILGVPG